jgi:flagellar FliL protein
MAGEEDIEDEGETPKKKRGGLVIGLVLALVGGGGAFAFTSGMLGGSGGEEAATHDMLSDDLAFIPVEPMTVSVGGPSERRHLRFRAELEVDPNGQSDIEKLLPRVVDVLNTYLQSLTVAEIEDPSALLTLRSQMRRRIDLVVGGDRVRDLLVMEFVLN